MSAHRGQTIDSDEKAGLSRRGLLGWAAAGGAGAVLLQAGAATSASASGVLTGPALTGPALAAPGVPPNGGAAPSFTPGLQPFPQQEDLNFQTLFNYGESAYNAAEVGEVATAVAEVTAAMNALGDGALPVYQPYNSTFEALAVKLASDADAEKAAGRLASARSKYLRAAGYYTGVLFFVIGTDSPRRETELYQAMQRCWAAAAELLEPMFQRVEIPVVVRFPDASGQPVTQNLTLPAYWARASGTGAKPTVIVNNGSDAQLVDTYAFGGAAALERGYNVLMFEGPGQGSLLFERNVPFTPYWEDVITPLVDFVIAQPETDASKVALTGWSFAGLLVMRAAAHEPRLKAVVADPVSYDVSTPYAGLKAAISGVNEGGPVTNEAWAELYGGSPVTGAFGQNGLRFLINKRSEIFTAALHEQATSGKPITDIVGFFAALDTYKGDAALFGQVTAHSLLVEYEGDTLFTSQGDQVKAWLAAAASVTQFDFTAAMGAEYHCAPMAPQVRNEVVYDWLDGVLNHAPTPPAPPAPPVPPVTPVVPVAPDGGGTVVKPALAATGLDAGPVAMIAGGLATAGAGAAVLASRLGRAGGDRRA